MDNSSIDPLQPDCVTNEVICSGFEVSDVKDAWDSNYCDINHDGYYLEKFRRAFKERNLGAQRWLQHRLGAVVLDWVHDHPRKELACRLHTEEYYVIQTFKRCWQSSLHHEGFEFGAMADVLYYLRVCLNGIILDELRGYSRPDRTLLVKSDVARESNSDGDDSGHEVWRVIEGKLPDARERRLAYLLFYCAFRPVEIVRRCPREFNDVREVSRLRRDIMELLVQ